MIWRIEEVIALPLDRSMDGEIEMDMDATIAQMASKRKGAKNVKSASKKKAGKSRKKAQSFEVDQENLFGYPEGQNNAPPGITVLAFDCSAENYFKVVDKICKLCGLEKCDDLDTNVIKHLSSSITFVREWRHFTYPPRAVRFSCQSESSPQGKAVSGGISLPQFSSASVPKNLVQNGNMLCQESSKDFVMYVGGPVWALDWCPRVHQSCESSDCHIEFIAIAAHPPQSSYHKIGAPLIGRGVIQIWCLLNVIVKEEEVPQSKKKAKKNYRNSSTGKVKSPKPKKRRGRPRKMPIAESVDNLAGNDELLVQALAVQFPENSPNIVPIDTVSVDTHKCVVKKDSSRKLKACRRRSTADSLMSDTSINRRRLKAQAREGNFVDPYHLPLLTQNENEESSPANPNAFLKSVQDQLESSAASCFIPKDVLLPRVVLCLAHNGKVAWDVKWRPCNIYDAESKHRMGYLAVLLGNGALEVWEVPLPQTMKAIYSTCQTKGTDPRFVKLEPVFRCSKLKCGDRQSIPLTVEWSASPHDFILAGCHDGVVALWKFSANGISEDTRPLLCFSADTVPIRGIAWAPVESDFESANVIVTAGHKGLKFWDIRDPFRPLWDLNPVQRNIYSLDWLPDPRCVIVSFDDGTLRILSLVKAAYDVPVTGKPFVGTQQQGFHSYYCSSFAIWSVQASRLTGMVAYCSADGTVLCFQLTAREVEKYHLRNRVPHFLCGSLTEEESTLRINTPLPNTPFPMRKSLNEWGNAPRTIRGFLSQSNQAKRAKERMSKGQPLDTQIPALCYGDDPGIEIGSEDDELVSLKKMRYNDQALVCRGEEPEDDIVDAMDVFPPKIVAMHRVRWNMNKGSERWLCYGGGAGIVRCQEITSPMCR